MRPTVIANSNASAAAGSPTTNSNGVNIPINHEYAGHHPQQQQQHPHHQQQQPYTQYADANPTAFGSPRQQQQQQPPHPQQQQQQPIPAHFQQGFGFEPDMDMDMDMDMFPRSRLGRIHHDPFATFGGAHFGFPQFGSLGRRRAGADTMTDEHDFFNRLPSEFRQYIPESFGNRRAGGGNSAPMQQQQPSSAQQQQQPPQQQYYQNYVQPGTTPPPNGMQQQQQPQAPTKKVCDAAIQTEDPMSGRSEVDGAAPMYTDNLKQHGLRNTVDMGVKSAVENETHGPRSHSAPPPEQLQQMQQQQQQPIPVNGKRQTPPPQAGQSQFGTQTSPHVQAAGATGQPQFQKVYYAPQQQTHPQQKQQTPPPPQTPGGTYVRTIPIFVEGRSEPIINSHKEIPNQNGPPSAAATASARAYAPPQQQQQYYQQPPPQQQQQQYPQQQQHRPTPLNTQQQPQQQHQQQTEGGSPTGLPPQTPHTLDSISKIQDIQRDVLDLMGKVENFKGARRDKEYAYLDEMLTRNLLKLDTIDTNGKDSIRLARKEAIKCIQASINVLEAKAEENAKTAQGNNAFAAAEESSEDAAAAQKSSSKGEVTKETAAVEATATATENDEGEAVDATKIQEPIPLPPPEGMPVDEQSNQSQKKEASPAAATAAAVSSALESSTSSSATAVESK